MLNVIIQESDKKVSCMKNKKMTVATLSLIALSVSLTGCFWKKKKTEKKITHVQQRKTGKRGLDNFNENIEAFVLAEDDKLVTPENFGRSSKNSINTAFRETADEFTPVHFNFDDTSIREDQRPIVAYDTQKAKQAVKSGKTIKVAGHSDRWCKSETYNWGVAQKRAATLKNALVNSGIEQDTVKAIGYGDSQPVIDTPAKEERNRRVEFALLEQELSAPVRV